MKYFILPKCQQDLFVLMAVMNLSGDLVLSARGGRMKNEIAENARMHAILVIGTLLSSLEHMMYALRTSGLPPVNRTLRGGGSSRKISRLVTKEASRQ